MVGGDAAWEAMVEGMAEEGESRGEVERERERERERKMRPVGDGCYKAHGVSRLDASGSGMDEWHVTTGVGNESRPKCVAPNGLAVTSGNIFFLVGEAAAGRLLVRDL
jgi:hypothetical protein